jgi:hypothetical protein
MLESNSLSDFNKTLKSLQECTIPTAVEYLIKRLYNIADSYIVTDADISEEWLKVDTIRAGQYHTQGFGAEKYAKAAAENIAFTYSYFGIPSWVKEIEKPDFKDAYDNITADNDYEVFVKCSRDLATLIKYKKIDINEVVKNMNTAQVNPNVFFPFYKPS